MLCEALGRDRSHSQPCKTYCNLISPSMLTLRFSPAISTVALAGKDSLPLINPSSRALATARSISRWELMPTILRNLRILRFKVSSFIGLSILGVKLEYQLLCQL